MVQVPKLLSRCWHPYIKLKYGESWVIHLCQVKDYKPSLPALSLYHSSSSSFHYLLHGTKHTLQEWVSFSKCCHLKSNADCELHLGLQKQTNKQAKKKSCFNDSLQSIALKNCKLSSHVIHPLPLTPELFVWKPQEN